MQALYSPLAGAAHPESVIGSSGCKGSSPYCSRNRKSSSGAPQRQCAFIIKIINFTTTMIITRVIESFTILCQLLC